MKFKLNQSPEFKDFAKALLNQREVHSYTSTLKVETEKFLNDVMDFFFPHCSGRHYYSEEDIIAKVRLIERDLITLLKMLKK